MYIYVGQYQQNAPENHISYILLYICETYSYLILFDAPAMILNIYFSYYIKTDPQILSKILVEWDGY